MQFPRKTVIAGVLLSLIPIGLGIAAITTRNWIEVEGVPGANSSDTTYSLWICDNQTCFSNERFNAAKGLAIAGVAAIAVGAIVTLLFDIFIKNRWLQSIPLILLYLGPVEILVGLLLYMLAVIDYAAGQKQRLDKLGYSIIFMLVSSLVGFLTAVYFAFATGFGIHRRKKVIQAVMKTPILIEPITERF